VFEDLIEIAVAPAAYTVVFLLAALIAIFVLPLVVLVGGWLAGLAVRIVFFPVRRALASFSKSETGTQIAQPLVAAAFFCFLTSRVSDNNRIVAFLASCTLILLVAGVAYLARVRYRPHFSEILFDERFIYPIWDWISYQRRVVTMLGGLAPLRPLVWAIQLLGHQIHHRRWQLFFSSLFMFSLYTLPIQLFPTLDRWLTAAAPAVMAESGFEWTPESFWLAPPLHMIGIIYLYLFDWVITVIGVYALVVLLAPLEPINNFNKIGRALQDFVGRRAFLVAGFFWQHRPDGSCSNVYPKDKHRNEPFEAMAKLIHEETLVLDAALRSAGHGCNYRAALVYEPKSPGWSEVTNSYCFHYRRMGRSSFLVAVDSNGKRFNGLSGQSQTNFQQLGESVGYLVSVRDSLR
jgi:hypothetical protein